MSRTAPDGNQPGTFHQESSDQTVSFANLVCVSFSAFDSSIPLPEKTAHDGVGYSYIGLKHQPSSEAKPSDPQPSVVPLPPNLPKTVDELAKEFVDGVKRCQIGLRRSRWKKAMEMLKADRLFAETKVLSLAEGVQDATWEHSAIQLFKALSSGHAVVLLIITRLVELVEERSLVLIDEPEGHLHPPLLSAFVRALSNLLVQCNGIAIVATHSPVVLQEVPRSCVWVLNRTGQELRADPPPVETFGENVGVLTREVFGLQVIHSGFHTLIEQQVNASEGHYDSVLYYFSGQLGAEGKAVARGLCAIWSPEDSRDSSSDDGK